MPKIDSLYKKKTTLKTNVFFKRKIAVTGNPIKQHHIWRKSSPWLLWLPVIVFAGFIAVVAYNLRNPAEREVRSALIGKPLRLVPAVMPVSFAFGGAPGGR